MKTIVEYHKKCVQFLRLLTKYKKLIKCKDQWHAKKYILDIISLHCHETGTINKLLLFGYLHAPSEIILFIRTMLLSGKFRFMEIYNDEHIYDCIQFESKFVVNI